MRGLILAGGFATRLRPLSCSKPKLLFPIVGVPLVEQMVRWLSLGGIDEVILAVNHLSERLKMDVGPNLAGARVVFSVEETPLGTAGPIRLAANLLGRDEPFVVINGDIVSDIDLGGMLALHKEKKADATIALVSVADPSPYGSVLTESTGRVRRFEEKSGARSATNLVNAGVYVLSPSVVDSIPTGRPFSIERDVFPKFVERGRMYAWTHEGFWYDIGRISEYVRANKELLENQVLKAHGEVENSQRVTQIVPPVHVGMKSRLGIGAMLGPFTILSHGVTIGDHANVRNSIIFEETSIGEETVVDEAVIGENVVIGRKSRIGHGSIIAGHLNLPEGSLVSPNSVILY